MCILPLTSSSPATETKPSFLRAVSHERNVLSSLINMISDSSVDWASLAKQWISMQQQQAPPPPPPPPPEQPFGSGSADRRDLAMQPEPPADQPPLVSFSSNRSFPQALHFDPCESEANEQTLQKLTWDSSVGCLEPRGRRLRSWTNAPRVHDSVPAIHKRAAVLNDDDAHTELNGSPAPEQHRGRYPGMGPTSTVRSGGRTTPGRGLRPWASGPTGDPISTSGHQLWPRWKQHTA